MSVDPEESKWTDYVLGETGISEKAEIESVLTSSPIARETVESIQETVDLIRDRMEEEPEFRLTVSQIQNILSDDEALPSGEEIKEFELPSKVIPFKWITGLAAIVLLTAFFGFMVVPGMLEGDHESSLESVKSPSKIPSQEDQFVGAVPDSREGQIESQRREGVQSDPRFKAPMNQATAARLTRRFQIPRSGSVQPTDQGLTPSSQQSGAASPVFGHPFLSALEQPLVDCWVRVDSEAYDGLRQTVQGGQFPETGDVRVGDLINYFSYNYASPGEDQPLSVHIEATMCPWNARHRLVQIGLRGAQDPNPTILPFKVVLLVDGVEIRQSHFDRAILLQAITSLRGRIGGEGAFTIIDGSRLEQAVLRVSADDRAAGVIDQLASIPPRGGIEIGVSNQFVLEKIVSELSHSSRNEIVLVLGGPMDTRSQERIRVLELLNATVPGSANYSILSIGASNGGSIGSLAGANHSNLLSRSVASVSQANRFWESVLDRTKPTVARDVKMQLEFNSEAVIAYRPLRQGASILEQNRNHGVSGLGEDVVSGQQVTTLFEVIPAATNYAAHVKDEQALAAENRERNQVRTQNMLTVKLNYRLVGDNQPVREDYPFVDRGATLSDASEDIKFSASVAAFGMVLSDAPFRGTINPYGILELAQQGLGDDPSGDRREFLELVKRTLKLILNRGGRVSG
ncbi:von Willebrand factor type A domain-containing protein [bacterium]|jgi:Ca-activated chloride channel homolog|nr:von Willebrand factor type A domain-containing protein [bacterium]